MLSESGRLGPYEITGLLGVGGMGEVYRARDTNLQRDVAIKILPAQFAADAERLSRFRREALVLAALNHPNIATIYGVEHFEDTHGLVLELIEGQTLADWIAMRSSEFGDGNNLSRTAMADSIAIARQIAEALDSAHERGIVHRDLKPANVKITPDGRVKVLDFGLAKARENAKSSAVTATGLTEAGLVVGTVPYMSPEQARGTPIDRRTDIWAFGCVLYELLAGRRPFPEGATPSDTLAALLVRDPDWTALPAATPVQIRALIEHCLQKDPRLRLRDIGDALPTLRRGADQPEAPSLGAGGSRMRERVFGAVALLAIAVAAVVALTAHRAPPNDRVVAFTVQAPGGGPLTTGQPLSPDGRTVAFIAASTTGVPAIWVRSIDSTVPRALEGTERAADFFWSPDSANLAFLADGRLKRIPAAGGEVQVICTVDLRGPRGGAWSSQNVILLGSQGPLLQVPATGGTPTPATVLDTSAGDEWHVTPAFLPDGRRFLFVVGSGGQSQWQAFVGSLDSPERHALAGIRSAARYTPTGHVLFTRGTSLMAQRFDTKDLKLSGDPVQIAARATGQTTMPFSVSNDGDLAYLTLLDIETELQWFDRNGDRLGIAAPRGSYPNPELSPDNTRIAVDSEVDDRFNLWVIDINTAVKQRLANEVAAQYTPIWSPDGHSLLYTSFATGVGRVMRRELAAVTEDAPVRQPTPNGGASDWSPDGRWMSYMEFRTVGDGAATTDLWAVPLQEETEPVRLTNGRSLDLNPRFSPNGRWIAYESNASGRFEIYIQAFPTTGGRQLVSAGGGHAPRWKADGSELFYFTDDGTVMSVAVARASDRDVFGAPTRLFRADIQTRGGMGRVLNVSKDGRFLLNVAPADREPASIVVLHNWVARAP